MNEDGVGEVVGSVMNFEASVAVGDCTCDEEHNDECANGVDSIMVSAVLG